MLEPQICLGNLAAYNNGILIFEWIDACLDVEELEAKAKEIINEYLEGEEFIIFNHQGFGAISISENESLERVSLIANALTEHEASEALSIFIENYVDRRKDFNLDQILNSFTDCFVGQYQNLNDFYDGHIEENLPPEINSIQVFGNSLRNYLDFEQMKEYIESCGDYNFYELNGVHFVFRNFS